MHPDPTFRPDDRALCDTLIDEVGFAMHIPATRPTFKLSQNKSPAERARIAAGLDAAGSPALAHRMRSLAP
jgi:transcriptional regulator